MRRARRRDVQIEVVNEAGQLMLSCTVHRAGAWQLQALPDRDAHEVTIDGIWLENEGWDHHGDVAEPLEPDIPTIDDRRAEIPTTVIARVVGAARTARHDALGLRALTVRHPTWRWPSPVGLASTIRKRRGAG